MDPHRAQGATTQATLDPRRPLADAAAARERLLALYGIGRDLLAQKEPTQVIEAIHRAIVEQLRPDHACVLSVTAAGSYRPLATHNLDLEPAEAAWPLSRTVLQQAHGSGLAILASDTEEDPRLGGSGSVHRYRIRSVMCVPIGRAGVEGLIYLDNRGEKRSFNREDLEFLTAVSAYASLALERARELASAREALALSEERLELLQGELLRHEIVGRSPALLAAYDAVRRFARAGARVLLRGETGTGKELFARAYAAHSARQGGPYVPVPIPALAPSLIESELFGHVRGAFTEASREKKGRLELAEGGVLFLDEVGDIEPALQPKLLRFLDSGELFRVGDTKPRYVDALVVSATNRLIEKELESGRFRSDLLARLGHVVVIPPLRERLEDVPLLVKHFLRIHDKSGSKFFAEDALQVLKARPWPLNVRELQQVVERAVCLVDHDIIRPEDLPEEAGRPALVPTRKVFRPLREVVEETKGAHILKALEYTKGNRRKAIEALGISAETFYRRLEEFGLRNRE